MQKYSILWVNTLLFLFLGGCAGKVYQQSEPRLITIKSPVLKFSDMGYIRHDKDSVEVELFAAGVAVEKISIDKKVCVNTGCMDEAEFTRRYLYPDYPADTMRRILLGEDIFDGKNKEELCSGTLFQFIRNDEMDVMYRRSKGKIYFKDRLNGLIIKIEEQQKENNETE